jgi:uncharacterized protein YegP (UPF0339 family)
MKVRVFQIIFTAILLLLACKKEPPSGDTESQYPQWPAVKTLEATKVDSTTAKLNGTVNGYGLSTTVTFEYGTTTSYGSTVTASESPVTQNGVTNVSADISGLLCGITYHFRIKAGNSKWINFYSPDSTFTSGHIPTLTTASISGITTTTAVSGGNIAGDGCTAITLSGVCWSKTANPTTSDSKTSDGVGSGQYVSNIIGLSAGTTYHIRAYATNSAGTAYGDDVSFSTLGHSPTSLTQPATNVSDTGATLNGMVNPNDLSTTVTFEYGITTSYGSNVTAAQSPLAGNTNTNVSADISGLARGTKYHFRVKAENPLGVAYGNDMEFLKQVPTITQSGVVYLTSTTATIHSIVNANSFSSVVTFEYGTTTSYGQEVTPEQSPVTGNINTDLVVTLTGLTCGTTYHFRVKAENSIGINYGDDITFSLARIPVLITNSVSGITDTSAISGGDIIDDGCAAVTARGVQWSLSPTFFCGFPPCKFSHTNDGTGTGSFTSNLTGLRPNTTYYVRAFATNSAGTTYGNVISFTTLP